MILATSKLVEIYPREGTETRADYSAVRKKALKFIPVRGRKLNVNNTDTHGTVVEIYPREGTETNLCSNQRPLQSLKFIPVRGRKQFVTFLRILRIVEIYPREGTETLYSMLC